MEDEVTVGDLDSNARGTGARKSAGKPALDLIPVRYWIAYFRGPDCEHVDQPGRWFDGLEALAAFQEGDDQAVGAFLASLDDASLMDTVAVFEFGAKKYKAWNWAKGMPWRVPVGCCLRHARYRLRFDRQADPESGCSHWGHFLCNMFMLAWYVDHYREGDDRPLFEDQEPAPGSIRYMTRDELEAYGFKQARKEARGENPWGVV